MRLRYQVYRCQLHGIVAAQRLQAAAWDDPEWAQRIRASTPVPEVPCPKCGATCVGRAEEMSVQQAGWFPDPEELRYEQREIADSYRVYVDAMRSHGEGCGDGDGS